MWGLTSGLALALALAGLRFSILLFSCFPPTLISGTRIIFQYSYCAPRNQIGIEFEFEFEIEIEKGPNKKSNSTS